MIHVIAKGLRRLRVWLHPRRFRQELDEELSFHLEMQTRWHEAQGLDPAAARRLAEREFGGETRSREAVLDARGVSMLHDLGRDVRYAVRSYRRSPGFTAVALGTLALGIGIATAAFSVIDAVLVEPLPYPEPDRLVVLRSQDSLGNAFDAVSAPNFYDWREQSRSFEAIALYATARQPVVTTGDAVHVEAASVSQDFFRVMRTPASIGRTITAADAEADEPVAVVSHGFWVRALGSPSPLPTTPLRLGDRSYRIVGVMPPGREFPAGVDVFTPSAFGTPWRTASRNNINFRAVARLAPGVTLDAARAEMHTIAARLHRAHPEDLYTYDVPVMGLHENVVGSSETYLRLLAGAVLVVVLVAAANLANANLARGAARTRELAIRTALGAGRARLSRQLLVESLVLAAGGGLAGVLLAWVFVGIARASAIDIPRAAEIGVNGGALVFALTLTASIGLAVGLAPALSVGRAGLFSQIGSDRATGGRGRAAARDALIGLELALAIVLLIGAGLLIRSFRVVLARSLGFEPTGAVVADLSLSPSRYAGGRGPRFYDELFASLRALPGVTAVGATNALPMGGSATGFIEVEGQSDARAGAGYRVVSDDYFRAMGIPLVRGRLFDARDDSGTVRVTLVNQRMADRFWPGQDPIGKRFRAKSMEWKDTPWLTVIGVVGDVRHWGQERDVPVEHYVLYRQRPEFTLTMAVIVRGTGDAGSRMRAVRERIRAIDADVAVDLSALDTRVDRSLAERRFIMAVLTAFGVLALVLAAVGVYGVLSFTVAQRTREIAVRMALGADRQRVLRLVVGRALRVAAAAAVVGLTAARAASRLMQALLVEVSPADPETYLVVTVLLVGVALLAAFVPARRAASVDPITALRSD